MNHNYQTRQLLIQTANCHHQNQNQNHQSRNTRILSSLEKNQDMYLDIADLVDDKKWDRIVDALHSIPSESISYVAKKLIGRLLREKHFTDEVVSLLDYISSGCSLEMRICQILEHNGSIDAMRYYIEKGAPFHLEKSDIPFPREQFKYVVPLLSSIDTLPKGFTVQMYYGPVNASLLCHVIDRCERGGCDELMKNLDLLLSLGADPNVLDIKTDKTPLMEWAMTFYFEWEKQRLLPLETLRLLLEKGANPFVKNKEGKDAFYYLYFWLNKADNYRSIPAQYMKDIKIIIDELYKGYKV